MSGKRPTRERKSTEFYNPVDSPKAETKTAVIEGEGVKLADIPNVNFKLDKMKGSTELVENLHQLLFKNKGKALSRKKDIKAFSGLVFQDSNKAAELEKLVTKLGKWTLAHLNSLLDLLDISRGSGEEGLKDKKIERLVAFIVKPSILKEKDLAAQAAQKKEKKEKSKAAKVKAAATNTAKKEAKSPAAKPKAASSKVVTEAPSSSKKRKAAASEEKPVKKVKKSAEKKGKAAAPTPKRWPPAKDVKADVEFVFQSGLDAGQEMTMGKIYAELATKYGMTTEGIKEKKAQIKTIVKNYEAQLEIPADTEAEEAEKEADKNGLQTMEIDEAEENEEELAPVVKDRATAEGDETQEGLAATGGDAEAAQPDGTKDIQPAPADPTEAPEASRAPESAKKIEEAKPATASPVVTPPEPEPEPESKPGSEAQQPDIFAAAILPSAASVFAPAVGGPSPTVEATAPSAGLEHGKENGFATSTDTAVVQKTTEAPEKKGSEDAIFGSLEDL